MGDETTSVQRAGRSVLVPRASTSSLEVCHFHGHRPKVLVLVRREVLAPLALGRWRGGGGYLLADR
jgi:hypothetical protein